MKDRSIPRPAGFRILMLVGILFLTAIAWLSLRPPGDDPGEAPPPIPPVAPPAAAAGPVGSVAEAPASPVEHPAPQVTDLGNGRFRIGSIEFDENRRTIRIPAAVHMRADPVEYILVARHGKVHESVFITDADARDIHVAALLLGMRPQPELGPENSAAVLGDHGVIDARVEWDRNGPPASVPLHETVILADPQTRRPVGTLPAGAWLYNGSGLAGGEFLASRNGCIISIIRDASALINNPGASRDNDEIHTPNPDRLPKLGHPVRIILKLR